MARLSDQEVYIMLFFWQFGAMKTDRLAQLVAEKSWKATTLLTFLSRLVKKGMLSVTKEGKSNLYTPIFSQKEYLKAENEAFLCVRQVKMLAKGPQKG